MAIFKAIILISFYVFVLFLFAKYATIALNSNELRLRLQIRTILATCISMLGMLFLIIQESVVLIELMQNNL